MRPVMLPVVCCASAMDGTTSAHNTIIARMIFFICQAPFRNNKSTIANQATVAPPNRSWASAGILSWLESGVAAINFTANSSGLAHLLSFVQQNFGDKGTGDGPHTQS